MTKSSSNPRKAVDRSRQLSKSFQRAGSSPGTLDHNPHESKTRISVIAYNESDVFEQTIDDVAVLPGLREKYGVVWIDVCGLGDSDLLKQLAADFSLHGLSMEDVVHVHQRPKFEIFPEYLFVIARMFSENTATAISRNPSQAPGEQLSIFVLKNCVMTFQEQEGDCLDPVRDRIRNSGTRIRTRGSDYLMYAVLDAVIDFYFPVVDQLEKKLNKIENKLSEKANPKIMLELKQFRRKLLTLSRTVKSHRDVLNEMLRDDHENITDETRVFLRDCYDHVLRISETIDTYRELSVDLRDFQMTLISNRTNDVMRTLTIIATIFIPLSFVAGLYGMNFEVMPELKWPYGYFFVLFIMTLMATGMLTWFYRRGWFSG
jgi:magnesium transporter